MSNKPRYGQVIEYAWPYAIRHAKLSVDLPKPTRITAKEISQ